jgi:chorismate mutase / prephenate dehydratase
MDLTRIKTMGKPDSELDDIRREIDAIDDGLMTLLERRFAASEHVRVIKSKNGALAASPFRPAREAAIMRRLLGRTESLVPAELLVRLWRVILTGSTQSQAHVTIHVSKRLNASMGNRLRIRDNFGTIPVEEYRDESQALMQVNTSAGDICIVETESPWVDAFVDGKAGDARIIANLPFLKDDAVPKMLVFGHSTPEATGDDESILVSDGKLPRDFTPVPLWQVKLGTRRISCLPGFLSDHESPLVGLTRSNPQLGLKIAGRYPSPFEIMS